MGRDLPGGQNRSKSPAQSNASAPASILITVSAGRNGNYAGLLEFECLHRAFAWLLIDLLPLGPADAKIEHLQFE